MLKIIGEHKKVVGIPVSRRELFFGYLLIPREC